MTKINLKSDNLLKKQIQTSLSQHQKEASLKINSTQPSRAYLLTWSCQCDYRKALILSVSVWTSEEFEVKITKPLDGCVYG